MSSAQMKLCPSCAGQLKADAASCGWCGAGLSGGEATKVAAAPPPVATGPAAADIGFGERSDRALPPLPPPPKSLPFTSMNPTQIVLRAAIVLGALYIVFTAIRMLIDSSAMSACNTPSPIPLSFCQ